MGSLQSLLLYGIWLFFSYQTERWGRPDVSRSPSTSNTGALVLPPQPFPHQRWGHPGQEIPPSHSPDPRAGLHPELQAWTQLPLRIWNFLTIKGQASRIPAASPAGGKAELFLENSRVCSRTQDGACTQGAPSPSLSPTFPLFLPLHPLPSLPSLSLLLLASLSCSHSHSINLSSFVFSPLFLLLLPK